MASPTVQRRRRRRVLALATAGLALCIGVSVTSLAAWQQSIDVTANGGNKVGSSLLKIELSLDGGGSWTTASVNGNGSLSFGSNASLLTPGDTVYASVLLRAAAGSRGASVTLDGGSVTDSLIGVLRYAAKIGVLSSDCTSTGFPNVGSVLVATGSLLTSGSSSSGFAVPAAPSSTVAGTPVGVCLAVSLPSGVASTVGGLNTSPVWQFVATSS
jgi:hypothetical protein